MHLPFDVIQAFVILLPIIITETIIIKINYRYVNWNLKKKLPVHQYTISVID